MTIDAMGIGAPINKKDLKELLKETKETIAVDLKNNENKTFFGVVDLWNVEKSKRTSISRMRRWLN